MYYAESARTSPGQRISLSVIHTHISRNAYVWLSIRVGIRWEAASSRSSPQTASRPPTDQEYGHIRRAAENRQVYLYKFIL